VFELSRGEGLRYSEIAAVLGISIKTVETQMGRALKSLRERLAAFL
jgi:RNA polymerase sigma-70 factor (ECF subfamily)